MAVDSAGNVYVADVGNSTIRKVTPAGVVTTLAGLWRRTGPVVARTGRGATRGSINPYGVAVDSAGNVYVADTDNHTIRKVTPAGVVTTLAGLAGSSGSADGTGSAARFYDPRGVAVDSAGNVYVADTDNHTIRKVTPAGVVTTLAGLAGSQGSADGTGSAARFSGPDGVAVDRGLGKGVVTNAASFQVQIQTSFTNGTIFYTVDGSGPDCGRHLHRAIYDRSPFFDPGRGVLGGFLASGGIGGPSTA